jgi:hypothetical protein
LAKNLIAIAAAAASGPSARRPCGLAGGWGSGAGGSVYGVGGSHWVWRSIAPFSLAAPDFHATSGKVASRLLHAVAGAG